MESLMADFKINDKTTTSSLSGTEEILVETSTAGVYRRITVANAFTDRLDDLEAQRSQIILYFNTLDSTTSNLWKDNWGSIFFWRGSDVEVTDIYVCHGTADTGGTQPTLDIKRNNSHNINDSTISFPDVDGTWEQNDVATDSTDSSIINTGDYLYFDYTVVTNGDNADAFVLLKIKAV